MQDKRAGMACEGVKRLFSAEQYGDDNETIAQAVAMHVATCPICTIDERALDTLVAQYRSLAQPPLPKDLEQRFLYWLCSARQE